MMFTSDNKEQLGQIAMLICAGIGVGASIYATYKQTPKVNALILKKKQELNKEKLTVRETLPCLTPMLIPVGIGTAVMVDVCLLHKIHLTKEQMLIGALAASNDKVKKLVENIDDKTKLIATMKETANDILDGDSEKKQKFNNAVAQEELKNHTLVEKLPAETIPEDTPILIKEPCTGQEFYATKTELQNAFNNLSTYYDSNRTINDLMVELGQNESVAGDEFGWEEGDHPWYTLSESYVNNAGKPVAILEYTIAPKVN